MYRGVEGHKIKGLRDMSLVCQPRGYHFRDGGIGEQNLSFVALKVDVH